MAALRVGRGFCFLGGEDSAALLLWSMTKPVLAIRLHADQRERRFLLAAAAVLRRAGQNAQARELLRRGHGVTIWRSLVLLVAEYIDLDIVIRG